MSKGPTKAQQALTEAREWIEASREEVKEREAALVEAQGQLVMHETIYAILEKTLTRQSPAKSAAKKSSKKLSKKSASKSASKSLRASGMAAAIAKSLSHGKPTGEGPICKICSYAEDYEDHSQPSPHYHPFEPSGSPAPRAGGKSSTNGGAGSTTQNLEIGADVAHDAAASSN